MNRLFFAACVAALTVSGCGQSPTYQDCARDVYAQYADAELRWQFAVHDRVEALYPEQKELLAASRQLQAELSTRGRLRLNYLLENHPNRVPLNRGLSPFIEFQSGWTEVESIALREADEDYVAVEARIRALSQRGENDPQWPALRAHFREVMQGGPVLEEELKKLREAKHNLESLLGGCRNLQVDSR